MRGITLLFLVCVMLPGQAGCHLLLPEVAHQPVIRNPFPQLSRIAVAPFFNQSDEPTLDGREVAMAYYAALEKTPGFEVVPLAVVEEAIIAHRVDLNGPGEARRLADLLGVDAVVVGAVTDYSPYYPPRCGLRVEWYSANPGFHEIPAGYGLPWNTPEEEFIPDSLVYESQMALARAQMESLTPDCEAAYQPLPEPPTQADGEDVSQRKNPFRSSELKVVQHAEEMPSPDGDPGIVDNSSIDELMGRNRLNGATDITAPDWPEQKCLDPSLADSARVACVPFDGPVLTHTRIYGGTDPDVTRALRGYAFFRDDARFGGWKAYLQRTEDFLQFCCHMHISEMLAARGGSRKSRLVWRWPDSR